MFNVPGFTLNVYSDCADLLLFRRTQSPVRKKSLEVHFNTFFFFFCRDGTNNNRKEKSNTHIEYSLNKTDFKKCIKTCKTKCEDFKIKHTGV